MLQIGNFTVQGNVVLGPMAGITDLAFRLICKKFGCSLVYSEMISSRALHYTDKKTERLLVTEDDEKPLCVQIFGSEPEYMAEAAEKIQKLNIASVLDINMGCPAPKIVNNNDGSALMKDIEKAAAIIKAVRSAVDLSLTVKFRSGWDFSSVNCVEFAKMCEESGADAITVHPRTRTQYYSGNADWNLIKSVKESVSIPVIGNGDVFRFSDVQKMIDFTNCDGVMISRGALGNPFIFSGFTPSQEEIINTAIEHLDLIIKYKGEYIGIREARKHMSWYVKGMHNAAKIKNEINLCTDVNEMKKLLNSLL